MPQFFDLAQIHTNQRLLVEELLRRGAEVELLRDVAVRITPLTDRDASEMIRSLATFPLLDGYRSAPRADVAAPGFYIIGGNAGGLKFRLNFLQIGGVFRDLGTDGVRAIGSGGPSIGHMKED